MVNGSIIHSKLHFYWLTDQKKENGAASFRDGGRKIRNIFEHHRKRHRTAGRHSLEMRLVSLWTNLSSRGKKNCERVLSQSPHSRQEGGHRYTSKAALSLISSFIALAWVSIQHRWLVHSSHTLTRFQGGAALIRRHTSTQ